MTNSYNSHLLLLKFHAIDIIISTVFDGTIHVSKAMVIVGGTSEALELAMALSQVICHVTHVTIIESHIPYYHKLTDQQCGAVQCPAASRPIAVLNYCLKHTISCLYFSNIAHCF